MMIVCARMQNQKNVSWMEKTIIKAPKKSYEFIKNTGLVCGSDPGSLIHNSEENQPLSMQVQSIKFNTVYKNNGF